MNDVHKVAARKLRSLATAIRAEAYAPHEFGVREAMEAEAVELERRADILYPVKPTAEEPTGDVLVTFAGALYRLSGDRLWRSVVTGDSYTWGELLAKWSNCDAAIYRRDAEANAKPEATR